MQFFTYIVYDSSGLKNERSVICFLRSPVCWSPFPLRFRETRLSGEEKALNTFFMPVEMAAVLISAALSHLKPW